MQSIQDKVSYIIDFSNEMQACFDNEEYLFNKINLLKGQNIIDLNLIRDKIYYLKSDGSISPVNFIRNRIIKDLDNNKTITPELIETYKQQFMRKNPEDFTLYDSEVIQAIQNYPKQKPFISWSSNFRVLYILLYNSKLKNLINEYLNNIIEDVNTKLDLKNIASHYVDFNGEQCFGSTKSWIAFYPDYKVKHINAIQLFLSFEAEGIKYGIMVGSDVKRRVEGNKDYSFDPLQLTDRLDNVIKYFQENLELFKSKNKSFKQFWKYSPGEQAKYWDEMKKQNIIAMGPDETGDLNNYNNCEEISNFLGLSKDSNISWNLDLFKNASIGDVVIVNKGVRKALGIGIIQGNYEFSEKREYYKHVRTVNWLVTDEVSFKEKPFRPDTFTPTLYYSLIKSTYLEKNPDYSKIFAEIESDITKITEPPPVPENINYYWLNANPKIWNFYDWEVGQTQTYTTFNSRGNKRRIYKNFLEVNPGDVVIGYLTTPIKELSAVLEVNRSLYNADLEGEVIEFKLKELLDKPISYQILLQNETLASAEPIVNPQGSLFKLTEEEFNIINNIIEEFNPKETFQDKEEYTLDNAIQECGMAEGKFKEVIEILKRKKQIVIQGAPGTGKTYLAKIIAKYLARDEKRFDIVQFHPSYSYEDFVEGFRPVEEGGLKIQNGIFKEICRKASINRNQNYVLIIDEINRGDISKIFGELLYLLEYRDQKIKLTYRPEIDFCIPDNLYLIGTMNLADRSLAMIDYALRRRFSFITLEPDYELIKRTNDKSNLNIDKIISNIKHINHKISSTHSLGKDFQIGHSFFIDKIQTEDHLNWIWNYEIEPLLLEYFFDSRSEVENLKQTFLNYE